MRQAENLNRELHYISDQLKKVEKDMAEYTRQNEPVNRLQVELEKARRDTMIAVADARQARAKLAEARTGQDGLIKRLSELTNRLSEANSYAGQLETAKALLKLEKAKKDEILVLSRNTMAVSAKAIKEHALLAKRLDELRQQMPSEEVRQNEAAELAGIKGVIEKEQAAINEIRGKITKDEKAREDAERNIVELNKQMQTLAETVAGSNKKAEIDTQKNQLADLLKQRKAEESRLKEVEERLGKSLESAGALANTLAAGNQEQKIEESSAAEALARARAEIDSERKVLEEVGRALAQKEAARVEADKTILELRQKIKDNEKNARAGSGGRKDELAGLESRLARVKEDRSAVDKRHQEMDKLLDASDQEKAALSRRAAELDQKLKEEETSTATARARIQGEIEAEQKALEEAGNALVQKETASAEADKSIAELRQKAKDSESVARAGSAGRKDELAFLENRLAKVKEDRSNADKRLKSLEEMLLKSEQDKAGLAGKSAELNQKLKEEETATAAARARVQGEIENEQKALEEAGRVLAQKEAARAEAEKSIAEIQQKTKDSENDARAGSAGRKDELAALESRLAKVKEDRSNADKRLKALEETLLKSEQDKAGVVGKSAELNQKLKEEEAATAAARARIQGEIENEQKALEEAGRVLAQKEAASAEAAKSIAELRQKAKDSENSAQTVSAGRKNEVAGLEAQLAKIKEDRSQVDGRLKELDKMLGGNEQEKAGLAREVAGLDKKLKVEEASTAATRARIKEEIDTGIKALEEARNAIVQKEAARLEAKKSIEEFRQKAKDSENAVQTVSAGRKNELAGMEERLAKIKVDRSNADKHLKSLEETLLKSDQEKAGLAGRFAELNQKIKDEETATAAARARIQGEIETELKAFEESGKAIVQKEAARAEAEKSNSELRQKVKDSEIIARAGSAGRKEELAGLEGRLAKIKDDRSNADKRLKALEETLLKSEQEKAGLAGRFAELNQKLKDEETSTAALIARIRGEIDSGAKSLEESGKVIVQKEAARVEAEKSIAELRLKVKDGESAMQTVSVGRKNELAGLEGRLAKIKEDRSGFDKHLKELDKILLVSDQEKAALAGKAEQLNKKLKEEETSMAAVRARIKEEIDSGIKALEEARNAIVRKEAARAESDKSIAEYKHVTENLDKELQNTSGQLKEAEKELEKYTRQKQAISRPQPEQGQTQKDAPNAGAR
jgi:chromosome segregation ATPase